MRRGHLQQHEMRDLLEQVESQVGALTQSVHQLQLALVDLMDENNRLMMRNHDLEDAILAYEQSKAAKESTASALLDATSPLNSKTRLQAYYEEGIHVCHPFFGARRDVGEECMFCQGILDGLAEKID